MLSNVQTAEGYKTISPTGKEPVISRPVRSLSGHNNKVTAIAYSPDGRMIASGSQDRTIKLWNTRTGKLIHSLDFYANNHHNRVQTLTDLSDLDFSPDGSTIVTSAKGSQDFGYWAGVILWSLNQRKPTTIYADQVGGFVAASNAVSISPNGKYVSFTGNALIIRKLHEQSTFKIVKKSGLTARLCTMHPTVNRSHLLYGMVLRSLSYQLKQVI